MLTITELDEFIELGAALEHKRWAKWQKYMFSKCLLNKDLTMTIPAWAVVRWSMQINTSYSDLSEEEKENDRDEVRKYIPILKKLHVLPD